MVSAMQALNERIYSLASKIIQYGITPIVKVEGNLAYTVDPVFEISRNRVSAECVKTLVRINGFKGNNYADLIQKLLNWVLENQNSDGSWNEVHVKYNHPSALITSIVGEALVDGYLLLKDERFKKAALQAKDFVLANQFSPGYFKKSSIYVADHLNVDATCGAFLAKYGKAFSDQQCLDAARITAEHVCKYQFSDGAFPYTNEIKGNYQYCLNIPCIHYQGVTLYYLLKIIDSLQSDWIDPEFKKGVEWLAAAQLPDGKFDWSKSGLMFAYYLSGAYAFAIPCFMYGTKWNSNYSENAEKALGVLEANVKRIVNRWESDSILSFPSSVFAALNTANIGSYPVSHRLFRFGYGMYRQFARRRFSNSVNPKLFNILANVMNINTSTVEPDNNFPDLFMTSEVLDCLSYTTSQCLETKVNFTKL
jgi:hypothetical protein